MAINFYKNHDQIVAAYKEVLDPKCNTNWALFGYEKQTNDLTLVDKGSGGLQELYDEFSQSKILYAFCEAKDPNSQVTRYILINWQGECAPLQRKGVCMNHFADVSNFFKGAHVEINARNEEDVEPAALMNHVSKMSSRLKIDKTDEAPSNERNPIGTNYKRIVPQNEISKKEREVFWQKQKQEEEERLNEAKKKESDRKLNMTNVKRDENAETPVKPPQSNQMGKERLNEAKSLISKNSINSAKAFFEQNSTTPQNNFRPERANTITEPTITVAPKVVAESNTNGNQTNAIQNGNASHHREEESDECDDAAEKVVEEANDLKAEFTDDAETIANDDQFSSNVNYANQFNYFPEPRPLENIEEEEPVNEESEVDNKEPLAAQGLRAKALYDYQAADDTEISFDPDDIITHIEQIDSGWWQGLAPNGTYGLFPANYVELLQ